MPLRLVVPPPRGPALLGSGIYGKTPAQGDFLRLGVSGELAGALDGWLETGVGALDADADWGEGAAAAPWRFAATAGALAPQALAGVFTASADKVGRRFPCLLVAPMAIEPAAAVACTPWYDAAEALLARVASGELAGPPLEAALAGRRPPDADDVDELELKGRSTPFGLVLEARRAPDGRSVTLQAMMQTASIPADAALWWRHDDGRTRLLATSGAPQGDAFSALVASRASPEAAEPRSRS